MHDSMHIEIIMSSSLEYGSKIVGLVMHFDHL